MMDFASIKIRRFSFIGALLLFCLCFNVMGVFASTGTFEGGCYSQPVPGMGCNYDSDCEYFYTDYPYYCPSQNYFVADSVTLTSSQSSQQVGWPINLTASASVVPYANINYRYILWYNSGSGWVKIDYGWHTGSYNFNWTPPAAGVYAVAVSASANTLEEADVISDNLYFNITYAADPTSVTISPYNPQKVYGNPQTFTATGQGSSHYEYYFEMVPFNGTSCNWASVTASRDWSSTNTWTLNPAAGQYCVEVVVRTQYGDAAEADVTVYSVTYAADPTGVTISPVNPQKVYGNPQTFTATGQGSSNYEYYFEMVPFNGTSCNWASVTASRGWSSANTWTVNPAAGQYCVEVDVRTQYGDAAEADVTVYSVTYAADPTGVTISPDNPQKIYGNPQTFTATGQGSSNYEYYFEMVPFNGTACNWANVTASRGWSSANTWTVNPAAGQYCVEVDVRTQYGDAAEADVTVYSVTYAADPTGVTISPVNPQKIYGNPQTFTATGQGSSNYEYYFEMVPFNGTACNWASVTASRDWSSANTWTLNPAAGQYCVEVVVRTQYGDAAEADVTVYSVTYAADPTGVTISPVNPQKVYGNPQTFTATGQGSSNYEYYFEMVPWDGTACNWASVTATQNWSSASTWTVNPAAGEYCVDVVVRTQYGEAVDDDLTYYSITNGPPPQSVDLSANPPSQQVTGNAVTFTASAAGSGSSYFEFSFWMGKYDAQFYCNPVAGLPERDWSSSSTWVVNMPVPGGDYCVVVEARTKYGDLVQPVYDLIDYAVTYAADPTGVSITANPPNGQIMGNSVTFTATGQGSSYYEYYFEMVPWNGTACNWSSVIAQRNWSSESTWTLPNLASGVYCVEADVRTEFGETADFDLIQYSMTAVPPLDITPPTLLPGIVGVSYYQKLSATGGNGNYSWISSGTLPAGISLSSDGTLSGTTNDHGSFTFTALVSDNQPTPATASQTYTLVIKWPPTDQPLLSAPANGAYVSGFGVTFSWTPVVRADSYILLVSTDPGFQYNVAQYAVTGATSKNVSGIFNNTGEVYYWTVAGVNSDGTGPSSYVKDFTNGMLQVSAVSSTVEGFKTSTSVCTNSTTSVATGAVAHDQELFAAKGGPLGVGIQLFYNSLPFYNGALGIGWSHSYDISLTINDDGSVLLRDGGGARSYYTWDGIKYNSSPGDFSTLTKNGDNSFTIKYRDDTASNFRQDGKITSIIDRFTNILSFTYTGSDLTAITDPAKRTATIHYDQTTTPHRIDYIIDPNTNRYDFAYQGNTLWKVIYPAADPAVSQVRGYWEYQYDSQGQGIMRSKKDPEGNLSLYTYYADNRMWQAIDPEGTITPTGHTRTIVYPTTTGNLRTATFTEKDGGQWLYTYDVLNGVLKEKSNPIGKVTSFTYYSNGLLKSSTDPKDGTVRLTTFYTYDSFGNLLTRTEPVDLATWNPVIIPENVTNPSTLASLTPPIKPAFSYSYDNGIGKHDRITAISDLRGTTALTTSFYYSTENNGEVVSAIDPAGKGTITRRYPNGTVKEIVDANNTTVSVTTVTEKSGATKTVFTYYPDTTANQTAGVVGLLQTVTSPDGTAVTITSYDKAGNPLTIQAKNTAGVVKLTSTQQHDALNRLKQLTRTAAGLPDIITGYGYDKVGNMASLTDAESRNTTYQYNYNGQVKKITQKVTDPTTHQLKDLDTVFTFSGTGCASCGAGVDRLTGVYDAKFAKNTPLESQPHTDYSYDQLGRVDTETDPLGKKLHYTYYDNGQLWQKYDATFATPGTLLVTYSYNNRGQITDKIFTDGKFEHYTYKPNGQMETASNQDISYTYAYYANGRLQTVTDTTNNRVISYDDYDGLGQRKQVTILKNAGADQRIITYDYDTANRPWHIYSPAGTFIYGYDNLGRRQTLTYPNQTTATYGYDDLNRLTSLNHSQTGGSVFLNYGYPDFDKVGNRKTRTGTSPASFGYDELYRLLSSTTAAGTENFTYDEVGNRQTGPGPKETATKYNYNAANQITASPILNYGYDNFGNQTSWTLPNSANKGWVLTWDLQNRLTQMVRANGANTQTITMKYDPFGQRIEKKYTTYINGITKNYKWNYVYDGDNVVVEINTDPTNAVTKTYFTHGAGTDEHLALERGGNYYFYHADGLGSVTAITDSARNIVQSYSYDSFGLVKPATSFVNSYTFAGREWDWQARLYYNHARYYDPVTGRFVSKDPISFSGGINLYSYVQNNPVNYIDPSGLETVNWFDKEKDPAFWALAEKARIRDKSTNVLTIEAHGRSNSVARMDIDHLIAAIDELERRGIYKKGMTIKLNSCRSAEGDNSIAQQLAQRKNVFVIGSERPVLGDGETYYGVEVMHRWVPGQVPGFQAPWSIFSPSGKRDVLN